MAFKHPSSKSELLALTQSLPPDSFFQEHSRARELDYIERSYGRWMEVIALAKKNLGDTKTLSCLDVGCSPFTFLLQGYFKEVSVLDLTDSYRSRCEASGIKLYGGGVTSDSAVSRIGKVDCVFCLEVLEHLHANPVEVIGRLRSVLRSGGALILSTPNMMCFANRVNMLLNKRLRHFTYPPFSENDPAHGFAHDRIYSPAELEDYFRESGFGRVKTSYLYHFNDIRLVGLPPWRRLVGGMVQSLKGVVPSFRDSTVMLGFQK